MPPQPPSRNLPIAPGGVVEELGPPNPRRARKQVVPINGQAAVAPPDEQMSDDEFLKLLMVRPLPGRRKGSRTGRVRVGHRAEIDGKIGFCHAFTITQAAFDALRSGGPLSSEGAVWPDGRPVAPKGVDPSSVVVRCASCGAEGVSCREMLFYSE